MSLFSKTIVAAVFLIGWLAEAQAMPFMIVFEDNIDDVYASGYVYTILNNSGNYTATSGSITLSGSGAGSRAGTYDLFWDSSNDPLTADHTTPYTAPGGAGYYYDNIIYPSKVSPSGSSSNYDSWGLLYSKGTDYLNLYCCYSDGDTYLLVQMYDQSSDPYFNVKATFSNAIAEPSSLALFGVGFMAVSLARRSAKTKAETLRFR